MCYFALSTEENVFTVTSCFSRSEYISWTSVDLKNPLAVLHKQQRSWEEFAFFFCRSLLFLFTSKKDGCHLSSKRKMRTNNGFLIYNVSFSSHNLRRVFFTLKIGKLYKIWKIFDQVHNFQIFKAAFKKMYY